MRQCATTVSRESSARVIPSTSSCQRDSVIVPSCTRLMLVVAAWPAVHATPRGLACAIASGSIASGIGYALWFAALPGLSATAAAISQLVVPVLAAAGAALLLGEPLTLRVIIAGGAILGGVALALLGRR